MKKLKFAFNDKLQVGDKFVVNNRLIMKEYCLANKHLGFANEVMTVSKVKKNHFYCVEDGGKWKWINGFVDRFYFENGDKILVSANTRDWKEAVYYNYSPSNREYKTNCGKFLYAKSTYPMFYLKRLIMWIDFICEIGKCDTLASIGVKSCKT